VFRRLTMRQVERAVVVKIIADEKIVDRRLKWKF
jgi:hypothetical protein